MSKGADNLKQKIQEYMRKYKYIKVTYENKAIFNLRWDIVINTKIPIVFEFQGQQHYKFTAFFHKDVEGSKRSKEYDNLKRNLNTSGKVKLIEVNKSDLTFLELCDLLEPYKKIISEENDECFRIKKGIKIPSRINNKKSACIQTTKRREGYFSICDGPGYKQK